MLLFAIRFVDLQERGGYGKIVSGSYSDSEIASEYFNSDNLIGNFSNIVFQDKSGNKKKLTGPLHALTQLVLCKSFLKT